MGNYQRQLPNPGWQFGTSSTANEAVWRYLLTDAPRENLFATRTVLGDFLDGRAVPGKAIEEHLENVVSAWLCERETSRTFDWRYYLVKYLSMRECTTGIYFGVDGKLSTPCACCAQRHSGAGTESRSCWKSGDQAELATRSRIHGSPGTTPAAVGSASCAAGSACEALPVALPSNVQTTRNAHRCSTASATNAKSL
jgi:hypothetical protein